MKLFVSVDMEGIWGVSSWEFMKSDEARELLHKEINLFLDAVESVEPDAYVLMVDSHSYGENIIRSRLKTNLKLDLISGYPRPNYMMTGIDETFTGTVFLGYHTHAGGWGAMDHSYSSAAIYRVAINGTEVGETTINGLLSHYYGVPVLLVSGTEELRGEVQQNLSEAVFHATNRTWSRFAAQSMHQALGELRETTERALRRPRPVVTKPGRVVITIDFVNRLAADVVEEFLYALDGKRLGPRTIEFTMEDYAKAFHLFQGIVFAASSAVRLQR